MDEREREREREWILLLQCTCTTQPSPPHPSVDPVKAAAHFQGNGTPSLRNISCVTYSYVCTSIVACLSEQYLLPLNFSKYMERGGEAVQLLPPRRRGTQPPFWTSPLNPAGSSPAGGKTGQLPGSEQPEASFLNRAGPATFTYVAQGSRRGGGGGHTARVQMAAATALSFYFPSLGERRHRASQESACQLQSL